jgi:hypothetical protein
LRSSSVTAAWKHARYLHALVQLAYALLGRPAIGGSLALGEDDDRADARIVAEAMVVSQGVVG